MTDEQLHELVSRYQAEQRKVEVVWFYRAVEKIAPRVIVEIGIKEGGNLKILSTHLDENGLCVGIDPRQDIPWKMDDARCPVLHVKGSSHAPATVRELQSLLAGRPIDVLFIDGDHSTEGMLADYRDYAPLVRAGGIIAVHDIFYLKEVTEAWARIEGERYESPRNQSSIGIGYVVKA
jgi:cephalosporin hydroxylase